MSDTTSGATILIVDDTPVNLALIVDYMEQNGFQVLVAQDGEEGLQRAEFAQPDLILLDVMMPGMDGFEVCRRLKNSDATRDIPVIFMTALADISKKLAGFKAGAIDYVTKPLDIEEVLARVKTHLLLRAMQARLAEQNRLLQQEIAERQQAESALQQAYDALKQIHQQLEQAQAQVLQSEKMASIGVLAAGVAHEINNPIGFVNCNLGQLSEYVQQLLELIRSYEQADAVLNQAAPELLATILRAKESAELELLRQDLPALINESKAGLDRVGKVVQDLRNFSHVGEPSWQSADIAQCLDSTLNIVQHNLEQKATVFKEYAPTPYIECMPQELNQVFMNILMNAVQAIPEHGEIHIRTGSGSTEAWIEIADTGCGIAPELLPRIFEPFFTTKEVGQGAGLGLYTAYATVRRHHGRIEVRSTPGSGATFRIVLPLAQAHQDVI